MNEVKVFNSEEFGKIRSVVIDNEPWFAASDLSDILGYSKTNSMRKLLLEDEFKMIDPQSADYQGGASEELSPLEPNTSVRRMLIINESGLYTAIFNSTLPEAKKFRRWVTSEVLPSIRKTGGYIATKEDDTPEMIMARAILVADETIKQKNKEIAAAKSTIIELEAKIEEGKPAVNYADVIKGSEKSMSVGGLAYLLRQSGYNIARKEVYAWMISNGYLYGSGELEKNSYQEGYGYRLL